jgi:hypothetical protein
VDPRPGPNGLSDLFPARAVLHADLP